MNRNGCSGKTLKLWPILVDHFIAWIPQHLVEGFIQRQQLHRIRLREGNERKIFTHLIVPAPERLGPSANCLLECLRLSHPLTASYWLNNKKSAEVELSPPTTAS